MGLPHRLFSGLEQFDGRLVGLNFLYLALVTLVPFSSDLLGDYGDHPEAVIVYAVNLGLLGLVGAVMVRYAFENKLMMAQVQEEYGPRETPNWALPCVFFASVPVALISPFAATLFWLLAGAIGLRSFRHLQEGQRRRNNL